MSELPTYPVQINAFEIGLLLTLISEIPDDRRRATFEKFFTRLIILMQKFRDEEGVQIEVLDNNKIKLTDKSGSTVIRDRYKWEI